VKPISDEIQFVPYQQQGESPRRAGLVRVEMDLTGLSDNDIQILGHLCQAVDYINPIYRDQFESRTAIIRKLILRLRRVASAEEKVTLDNYRILLDLQNSPFSQLPRKNHLLGLERSAVEELVKKCKSARVERDFEAVAPYFFDGLTSPDRAHFYPEDFSEGELDSLGDKSKIVNSSVVRDRKGLRVVLNEERYRKDLDAAIGHLKRARELSDNPSFQLYLDAKMVEMSFGTAEARRLADYTWVRHTSKLDIVISSAIEVYLDNWKNARGAAAGAVLVENPAATELLQALISRFAEFETTAPWTYKKETIDETTLPKLKFVDVLNWSGDYVNGPMTIIAQSLPNDDWVIQKIGSVNLVYYNTGRAIHKVSGLLAAKEFLPARIYAEQSSSLFDASQLHSALHELGHTTGMMDPQHREKQPREYLEVEYSGLEETRAELFGLWAMPLLVREGVIEEAAMHAAYNAMLMAMITSLKFEPKQAHNKARNMMWHYFFEKGAVSVSEEEGRTRYETNLSKIHGVTTEMLRDVANTKASGSKELAQQFREKWCYDDELRPEIESRTKDFPLGRGLIFPKLKTDGERFLPELVYPKSFSKQEKFERELLS
jgi:hypothetical protein